MLTVVMTVDVCVERSTCVWVIVVSVDVTVDAIVFVIIEVTVAVAWVVDVTEDVMVMLEQAGEA
jgi:hypothetical protein